ncbi:hypothetical protein KC357_g8927 [Hortaea werneckii]|nr:hypothetical protein KC357_g8927 [Hortaea werneckii]
MHSAAHLLSTLEEVLERVNLPLPTEWPKKLLGLRNLRVPKGEPSWADEGSLANRPHEVKQDLHSVCPPGIEVTWYLLKQSRNTTAPLEGQYYRSGELTGRETYLDDLFYFSTGAEYRDCPMQLFNLPMDDVFGKSNSTEYQASCQSHITKLFESAGSASFEPLMANLMPRGAIAEIHHDSSPGISTACALRNDGENVEPVKLWLIYPHHQISPLGTYQARRDGEPEAHRNCLEQLSEGGFWLQRHGESLYMPPWVPHSTLTLRNSYLVGQQFYMPAGHWLDREMNSLWVECRSDIDRAKNGEPQLRLRKNMKEVFATRPPSEEEA